MSKYELSEKELDMIKRYQAGEINVYAPEDTDRELLQSVIHKAEAVLQEFPGELFDDLVLWYQSKCQDQRALDQ